MAAWQRRDRNLAKVHIGKLLGLLAIPDSGSESARNSIFLCVAPSPSSSSSSLFVYGLFDLSEVESDFRGSRQEVSAS